MASKNYSVRLIDECMGLFRSGEPMSPRLNQMLRRYSWLIEEEQLRVRRALSPAIWRKFVQGFGPDTVPKTLEPERLRETLCGFLDAEADVDAIDHLHGMSAGYIVVLVECIEAECL
jgi:hypothetical protein